MEKETEHVTDQQRRVDDLKVVEERLQRTIDEKKQIIAALDSSLAHSKSQESALKKQKKQLDNVVNRLTTLEKENEKLKKAAKHNLRPLAGTFGLFQQQPRLLLQLLE